MSTFFGLPVSGQTQWEIQNSLGFETTYFSLAFGNDRFVLATGWGTVFTSTDGTEWVEQQSSDDMPLYSITCGNGLFVAIGELGRITTSPDGIEWTEQECGVNVTLVTVTYGNELFVAVGDVGTILTSPDGVDWTLRETGTSGFLNGIVYGDGIFVACGDYNDSDTSSVILTSPDGIIWSRRNSGVQTTIWPIAYGNGVFIAANNSWYRESKNGVVILYSYDGITWNTNISQSLYLQDIVFANDRFVAAGEKGSIITSENGIEWNSVPSPTNDWIVGLVYGNDRFIAFTQYGVPIVSLADNTAAATRRRVPSENGIQVEYNGSGLKIYRPTAIQSSALTFSLLTLDGRLKASYTFDPGVPVMNLPLSGLAKGQYIVTAGPGGGTEVCRKIVKK